MVREQEQSIKCLYCDGIRLINGLCYNCIISRVRGGGCDLEPAYDPLATIPALPLEPTTALPGTAEKIEVMRKRVENKQQVFHPNDAKLSYIDESESPTLESLRRAAALHWDT